MIDIKADIKNIFGLEKISESDILNRNKQFNIFKKNGFPNKNLEDWKFIDLNQELINQIPNLQFENKFRNKVDIKKILKIVDLDLSDKNYILNVNGFVKEINLSHEIEKSIEIQNKYKLENDIKIENLENLNLALNTDYLKVVVKKNYHFKKPLVIINFFENTVISTNINKKIDIELEENSRLSLLNVLDNKAKNVFFNYHLNLNINKDSVLKNYLLDKNINMNLNYIKHVIDIKKNAVSENVIISKNSDYTKNEIVCNLLEQFSSAFVNGIIDLNKSQKHEIRTIINHLEENTKSYQLIKCVLNDESKAVYQGKICVDSKAQKTDGYQSSKAILLNKNTEFNGKPELEIYADDVKCSHGSSSGNLDENKIFYLMTRGLNNLQAKKLLLDGYLMEVVEKITDERIKSIIKQNLKIV